MRLRRDHRGFAECGGKNFHFIHPSACLDTVAAQTMRSAFEYSGQKCSACSRAYIPESIWPKLKEKMLAIHKEIKVGDVSVASVVGSRVASTVLH